MREVELIYVEVLNETEQVLVFATTFNNEPYGAPLTLNTALPVDVQDIQIRKTVTKLERMKTKDAKEATVL